MDGYIKGTMIWNSIRKRSTPYGVRHTTKKLASYLLCTLVSIYYHSSSKDLSTDARFAVQRSNDQSGRGELSDTCIFSDAAVKVLDGIPSCTISQPAPIFARGKRFPRETGLLLCASMHGGTYCCAWRKSTYIGKVT